MLRSSLISSLLLAFASALPQQGQIAFDELFGRQAACPSASPQVCGYNQQLCCPAGGCYTDSNNQAQCSTPVAGATAAATTGWVVVTTTITGVGPYTVTSTYSTSLGAAVTPASIQCNYALNEKPCGNICCASSQFCLVAGDCRAAVDGGSSGYYSTYYSMISTNSAGVPLRPTSSTLVVITAGASTSATATASSTTTTVTAVTQPFQTPVATGANVTVTQSQASSGGGGLSGGAIAGIVIGVLLALFILGLICFYCCLKGILDGCLAIFGLGKNRKRKEVDEYERYSHHGASAGRTWYGARKPDRRDDRRDERKDSRTKEVLGIGAVLAALWAILGLKRRNERKKNEEKYSEYSYYSSDYYTSESSASSDRRTRDDRRPRR